MAKIYKQITDLIGKTPLVELGKYSASKGLETPVIAKVKVSAFVCTQNGAMPILPKEFTR